MKSNFSFVVVFAIGKLYNIMLYSTSRVLQHNERSFTVDSDSL